MVGGKRTMSVSPKSESQYIASPGMAPTNKMDFDELTDILGQFGKYQKIIYFLICLIGIQCSFNNMSIMFIGGIPDHWCSTPQLQNLSVTDNITEDIIKTISIPHKEEGSLVYSRCEMYERGYRGWGMSEVTAAYSQNKSRLTTVQCKDGWTYDTSQYTSTIVTQVRQTHTNVIIFIPVKSNIIEGLSN